MNVDQPVMLLDAIQWARQGHCGPPVPYCAGCVEGRHVAEAGEIFDRDLHAWQPRVGDDFGLRVERAVIAIGNPYRDALTLRYIAELPAQVIARRLGVRDAARVLDLAHEAVGRRLL